MTNTELARKCEEADGLITRAMYAVDVLKQTLAVLAGRGLVESDALPLALKEARNIIDLEYGYNGPPRFALPESVEREVYRMVTRGRL